MNIEKRILDDIVDYYLDKAVKSAVHRIQRVTKDAMTLNVSYLKNVWDEICVQKQNEECFHWGLIDNMVEMTCELILENMPNPIQMAISYKAYSENFSDGEYGIIYSDDAVRLIKEKLYAFAINYSNHEIERYNEEQYLD